LAEQLRVKALDVVETLQDSRALPTRGDVSGVCALHPEGFPFFKVAPDPGRGFTIDHANDPVPVIA
jgi:hypothetical protein